MGLPRRIQVGELAMRSTVPHRRVFRGAACQQRANAVLPYGEAIVALRLDGTPTWHWKPGATDTQDLDFGAAPNLFTITVNEESHDVVGEGAKDGTYYVLDRDGVNGVTGVRWDDNDPSALPYWRTNVVPGDSQGGNHRGGGGRRGGTADLLQHRSGSRSPEPAATYRPRARRHGHDRVGKHRRAERRRELRAHQRHPRRGIRRQGPERGSARVRRERRDRAG